ncbi:MAG: translation elongation factor 4 [bacterium]
MKTIRNFSFIAHIDHGKSTLADRVLEITGVMKKYKGKTPVLDRMTLEKERGITIKAKAVNIPYKNYNLNLIDTPGHVDFSYEVSRSLAACEGTVLIVDAAKGIEAQTIANLNLARENNLKIIPVLNKIDLPNARMEQVSKDISRLLECRPEEILYVSAKEGTGVKELLDRIVEAVPPPEGDADKNLKALIFDSNFDPFRGVIIYIRLYDGEIRQGMKVKAIATGKIYEIQEVGVFKLIPEKREKLSAGEVGYAVAGVKELVEIKIGDTLTGASEKTPPVPGFREIKPFVFSSFYPLGETTEKMLREAIMRLHLNDAAFSWEAEKSKTLGLGYRLGFMGSLHMEIVQERLERESEIEILATAPQVIYRVKEQDKEPRDVSRPDEWPAKVKIEKVYEPEIIATVITPDTWLGPSMKLLENSRAKYISMNYINQQKVILKYKLPLAEMIAGFYSALKSVSKGYASFDYRHSGFTEAKLDKVDILVNGVPVEALSTIQPKEKAYYFAREILRRLRKLVQRQLFEVALQAKIGGRIIARETISAIRKDVIAKCYGGDITRKRKLLEKQKEGKKRMKRIGSVDLPQEVFFEILKK